MPGKKLDPRTIDFPEEQLKQLYITERLTINQIAQKLGCSTTPIWRSLKRHNIRLQPSGGQYTYHEKGITLKKLKHLYLKRKLSVREIKQIFQCNPATVVRALKHFDIAVRSCKEANIISAQKRVWGKNGHGRNWGGGITYASGYRKLWKPEHPRANKQGYVFEHIMVWEKTHGKPVPKGWVVHHFNAVKTDNRPENLVAMSRAAHRDLAKPYIKRIRQLEAELKELQQLKLTIG